MIFVTLDPYLCESDRVPKWTAVTMLCSLSRLFNVSFVPQTQAGSFAYKSLLLCCCTALSQLKGNSLSLYSSSDIGCDYAFNMRLCPLLQLLGRASDLHSSRDLIARPLQGRDFPLRSLELLANKTTHIYNTVHLCRCSNPFNCQNSSF